MTERLQLTVFLEAPNTGGFRLVTGEGAIVLERATYQRLRSDLRQVVGAPIPITVLVGRLPASRAP